MGFSFLTQYIFGEQNRDDHKYFHPHSFSFHDRRTL